MGLASKLGTGAPAGAVPSAPPIQGGAPLAGQYGAPPPSQTAMPAMGGAQGGQPGQFSAPGSLPSGQQTGQFGQQPPRVSGGPNQVGQQQQYPSQIGQQPGQFGQQPGQFPGQQPGQFPGQQLGQRPGQYPGQQPGQYPGQQPGQYSGQQQAGQYGAPHGQQYGGAPGQPGGFGAPLGGFGMAPPQQQFGGGLPQGQPGSAGFDIPTIRQKLQQLVTENRLQAFYPPQRLDQLAQFVAGRDVTGLGMRWKLPREVTLDLIGLALYDIVLYVDDSGSMAFEEGGERIDDMKAVLGRTADAATLFDTDGIVVRFMNGAYEGNGIRSEAEASALVQNVKFSGTTPLGSNLDRKVLQPMVISQARSNSMQKPVLVICITDGEPSGEPKDTTRQVIMNAKTQLQNTPYGPGAVAFQFAQVGKDAAATRFLSALDTDPVIGSLVDCTSYYEQEQEEYARKGINLDPSLYLVKLMVGGIDRSYDEGDEG